MMAMFQNAYLQGLECHSCVISSRKVFERRQREGTKQHKFSHPYFFFPWGYLFSCDLGLFRFITKMVNRAWRWEIASVFRGQGGRIWRYLTLLFLPLQSPSPYQGSHATGWPSCRWRVCVMMPESVLACCYSYTPLTSERKAITDACICQGLSLNV